MDREGLGHKGGLRSTIKNTKHFNINIETILLRSQKAIWYSMT